MPRSMADPNYRYTPWTPERRQRASEAAKERWRQKRAAEEAQRQRKAASPIGKATEEIIRLARRQDELAAQWRELAAQWRAVKLRRERLIEAREQMEKAFEILKEEGCEQWLTWLND
jgi:hypothetical protein